MNQTYFSPKTEKRESGIDGRGLFAGEPISKGETVVVKGGYVMTKAQRDRVSERLGPAEIQVTEDLFIGPTFPEDREGGMMHLNHSCEPNLVLHGQIVFVARRDISVDEELTFDYGTTDDEPWEMECSCGTPSCRGTVTGHDWKKRELQEKYDGQFSWFIQRRLEALTSSRSRPRREPI